MFSESKMAGPGYITLNVIRVLNIITLLLVVVASWVMLVMTVKTSNFFFFDGVSHFITQTIGLFLVISELSLFRSYFARHWPMLSPESGFVFLGMAMMVLGFNILGNLNKGATSVENLGLPMWRIVISSGILSALMGLFNIVATYVFCDSQLGITGRQVRMHGAAVPRAPNGKSNFSISSGSLRRTGSKTESLPRYVNEDTEEKRQKRKSIWKKFPLSVHTSSKDSGFKISAPVIQDPEQFNKFGITQDHNLSNHLDDRRSPVMPEIERPPTALHPSNRTRSPPPVSESNYSQSTRFPHYSAAHNLYPFSGNEI